MSTETKKPSDLVVPIEGTQVPIERATKDQIKAFAEDIGITVKLTTPGAFILKQLKVHGWDENYIIVRADPDAGTIKEPMVQVRLPNQEGPGGKQAKFVAVNGVGILIPRAKSCAIKLRYVKALEIAVETTYELSEDPETRKIELVASDAPTSPLQIERYPTEEEIARWKAYEMKQPEWHNSLPEKNRKAA